MPFYLWYLYSSLFFFFNDTATTEIYTLSLHDALPISVAHRAHHVRAAVFTSAHAWRHDGDRKSTRLNSSHSQISYAGFCLKKKNKTASTSSRTNTTCKCQLGNFTPHTN